MHEIEVENKPKEKFFLKVIFIHRNRFSDHYPVAPFTESQARKLYNELRTIFEGRKKHA